MKKVDTGLTYSGKVRRSMYPLMVSMIRSVQQEFVDQHLRRAAHELMLVADEPGEAGHEAEPKIPVGEFDEQLTNVSSHYATGILQGYELSMSDEDGDAYDGALHRMRMTLELLNCPEKDLLSELHIILRVSIRIIIQQLMADYCVQYFNDTGTLMVGLIVPSTPEMLNVLGDDGAAEVMDGIRIKRQELPVQTGTAEQDMERLMKEKGCLHAVPDTKQ